MVLGNLHTKRTGYLRQAAVQAGLPVFFDKKAAGNGKGLIFTDWSRWREELTENEIFLKIEPPLWKKLMESSFLIIQALFPGFLIKTCVSKG